MTFVHVTQSEYALLSIALVTLQIFHRTFEKFLFFFVRSGYGEGAKLFIRTV